MKNLTWLLLVFIGIMSTLYYGVSHWDNLKSEIVSFKFLDTNEDQKLSLALKQANKELSQLKIKNKELEEKLQSSYKQYVNYKDYSLKLKDFAEDLLKKYAVLKVENQTAQQKMIESQRTSVSLSKKLDKYNQTLLAQNQRLDAMVTALNNQPSYIEEISNLKSQLAQINTNLTITRFPASIESQKATSPKVKKIKIIYKTPVDKFN